MVVKNDGLAWQVLVFDSPEPDVFLSTGDQFVTLDWREFDAKDVKVAHLLGD